MMMSPRLTPMRKSMRRSAGTSALRAAISRWTSTAQRTASTTLATVQDYAGVGWLDADLEGSETLVDGTSWCARATG